MMKHVVALSGGKDSTAMSLRLRQLHPEIDFEFVCTPTGDELPEMQAHFQKLGKRLGKKLKNLANDSLCSLIARWQMLPNHRARWCTRVIKIEPFIDYMETLEPGSIMYVGLRADEAGRLGLVQPDAQFVVKCPMQDWGWVESDVIRFLECCDMKVPRRTDCARCFWNTLHEWYLLDKEHPEIYQEAVEQEKSIGHTFRSPMRDTWPASLAELREEFRRGRIPKPRLTRQKNPNKCRFCTM